MAESGLIITSDTLTPGLKAFPEKLDNALGQTAEFFTPRVEAYARENAPWTDRTGNARSGLNAQPFHEFNNHGIIIAHGVPYGIWLEIRFEGRYEIIIPTVKEMGRQFMDVVKDVFRRMH